MSTVFSTCVLYSPCTFPKRMERKASKVSNLTLLFACYVFASPTNLFIYIYFGKTGVRINEELKKIPEGQEYAPRLEPAAPIRLADRNHAHYTSRHSTILIKRRLDDGLQGHAFQSPRESSEDVTRTHVLTCGLDCVCWKSVIEPSFYEDGAVA